MFREYKNIEKKGTHMKRKELMKKCKKVFSAVLAAAMIATSAVPESLVFASGQTEDFVDEESVGFGAGSDSENTVNKDENSPNEESTSEPQADDFSSQVDVDGWSDGEAEAYENTDPNGLAANVEGSEEYTPAEIQQQIDALPSVEECKAMTDEEKMSVYETAQKIADAYENLSEEEKGQLDISKLETLFEYINQQTEELSLLKEVSAAATLYSDNSIKTITTNFTWNSTWPVNIRLVILDKDIGTGETLKTYGRKWSADYGDFGNSFTESLKGIKSETGANVIGYTKNFTYVWYEGKFSLNIDMISAY